MTGTPGVCADGTLWHVTNAECNIMEQGGQAGTDTLM